MNLSVAKTDGVKIPINQPLIFIVDFLRVFTTVFSFSYMITPFKDNGKLIIM